MNRKGFTLIEILIVVAIIGILSTLVLLGLAPARQRARDARRLSDLKSIQSALEVYSAKAGKYPDSADCSALATDLIGANIGVSQVPKDPTDQSCYPYVVSTDGLHYTLSATLEEVDPAADIVANGNGLMTAADGSTSACTAAAVGTRQTYCVNL